MKVLHINRNYLTSALHQVMMDHLDSHELTHTVFAPTDDIKKTVIIPNPNVVTAKCFTKVDRLFFHIKQKKIQRVLEKEISVSEYSLIHAYTLFTDGNCAMQLSQKYGIPYVVAVRNTDVNDFFRKLPYLRNRGIAIMRNASKVFFLSCAYRNQVFEKYIPRKYRDEIWNKTEVIPNGIEDFWIENKTAYINPNSLGRIQSKKLNLVFAGRIDRNKNISTTIGAMKYLQKDGWNVKLTVVGKVIDKREYERFSRLPNVTYHPPVGKEKLIEFYRGNDIFVMPSHTESFGLVYVEAMTQGLPVVYTRGQGFDKQFEDGLVGYPVSDTNSRELAYVIEKIAADYQRISKSAVEGISNFSWNKICDSYVEIYKSIASGANSI